MIFIIRTNYLIRLDDFYGSQLFLVQLPIKYLLLSFIILLTITYLSRKYIILYNDKISNLNPNKIFLLIILIAFIFKSLLYGFSFEMDVGQGNEFLEKIFEQGRFNQYKLYSYIVLIFSKIFDNFEYYLILLNILLGGITIALIYLIFNNLHVSKEITFLATSFTLLYIPINFIETMIRVDTLFFFLFILTIYFAFRNMNKPTNTNIIYLCISLLLLCFCRESTLYLLPLFLIFTIFSSKKRILSSLAIIIVTLVTTSYLSNINKNNHGMNSYIKDYHLIYNMQHYGYFNERIISSYKNKLSSDAVTLLNDINNSYITSVPPHKRRPLIRSHIGGIIGEYWYLIRPDTENVIIKSSMTEHIGSYIDAKRVLVNSIDKLPKLFTINQLDKEFMLNLSSLDDDDRELSIFIKDQLVNTFLLKTYSLSTRKKMSCVSETIDSKIIFDRDCVKRKAINIQKSYVYNQSDNWSYKRGILHHTWKFDEITRKYVQHPNIDRTTEILLAIPSLYIIQSTLSLFGMSGYVPIPSGLGSAADVFEATFFPKVLTIYFQALYILIINFWYVFCFGIMLHALLSIKYDKRRIQEIILAIIPFYYIFFISFAAQFEFSRLITPVIPFVIYSFFSSMRVILNIYKKRNII